MDLLDRVVRRVIPSAALLGRTPWIIGPLALVERLLTAPYPEYQSLPPARLRVRIGVSNRPIFNQPHFLEVASTFWMHYLAAGMVRWDSNVVDIGSGCGRFAHIFHRYTFGGERFTGTYTGIDVDREMIDWCAAHYPSGQYRFIRADTQSAVYNPTGKREPYAVPLEDESQDFVFSASLFTHLLADDVTNYVRESFRVLKPGGWMSMTAFVIEDLVETKRLGGRWTFQHHIGPARVENVRYPEAAVAYPRDWFHGLLERAGFTNIRITPLDGQSILEAQRPCHCVGSAV